MVAVSPMHVEYFYGSPCWIIAGFLPAVAVWARLYHYERSWLHNK